AIVAACTVVVHAADGAPRTKPIKAKAAAAETNAQPTDPPPPPPPPPAAKDPEPPPPPPRPPPPPPGEPKVEVGGGGLATPTAPPGEPLDTERLDIHPYLLVSGGAKYDVVKHRPEEDKQNRISTFALSRFGLK